MHHIHLAGNKLQHVVWILLIMTQLISMYQCQEQTTEIDNLSKNCRQNSTVADELLLDAVSEEGFCPWSEECNDSCNSGCSQLLASGNMFCGENDSDERSCLAGPCIHSSPVTVCYMIDVCQCTNTTSISVSTSTCCVQAIDSLIWRKQTGEMSHKLCFIPPDSGNQNMECVGVKHLCDSLKRYACEDVCRARTTTSSQNVVTTTFTPSIITSMTSSIISSGGDSDSSGMTWLRLAFYIGGPLLALLIVSVCIAIVNYIWKMRKSQETFEAPQYIADLYTTIDHPQRTQCPPERREPNIDNPMYDMQILGDSTNDLSNSRPTSLTRSYENLSPTTSIPSTPNSEHAMLLPGSKSSTGSNQLDVPVFNALNNKQRGTRSRVTFMDRTPSPQPDGTQLFPGFSEEYESICPSEPSSPRDSTTDETIPMIRLSTKKDSGGGYENATLSPNGKLRTIKRDCGPGYENSSPDVADQASNEIIYDYAEVGCGPRDTKHTSSTSNSPTSSPNEIEYAIPGTHKFSIPKLKPVSRHGAASNGGNQYNTLGTANQQAAQQQVATVDGDGEYCKLRREGNEIMKAKEALKSLPDVIRVVPKPR